MRLAAALLPARVAQLATVNTGHSSGLQLTCVKYCISLLKGNGYPVYTPGFGANERQHVADQAVGGEVRLDLVEPFGHGQSIRKERDERFLEDFSYECKEESDRNFGANCSVLVKTEHWLAQRNVAVVSVDP